jgi:hypothetical protein
MEDIIMGKSNDALKNKIIEKIMKDKHLSRREAEKFVQMNIPEDQWEKLAGGDSSSSSGASSKQAGDTTT